MALKVIGAGFGRTGTSSLKEALETLGFEKCYHATEVFGNPEAVARWCDVIDGNPDWSAIFEGYQSSVDWPACAFYKEQMAAYPTAKVVLSVRNPESWYRSVNETIYPLSHLMAPKWLTWFSRRARNLRRIVFTAAWEGQLQGKFEDKNAAIAIFNEHIETVKREVPAERLLVFDVRDGWAPLCAFLGISDVPDEPFPHVNEAAELKKVVARMRWIWRIGYAVVIVLILWGISTVVE